jgi:hypothetical protein
MKYIFSLSKGVVIAMPTHYETVALIDAPPADVYAVLADYHHGHPQIVPSSYLRQLEVEAGGQGEGTIIRYRKRLFGLERQGRATVHEPEPGRLLTERETTSSLVTTFAVTPVNNGKQTHVQIAARWEPAHTLRGKLEQALYPYGMHRMFVQELNLLAKFVGKQRRSNAQHKNS